jgi:hypothetical protein
MSHRTLCQIQFYFLLCFLFIKSVSSQLMLKPTHPLTKRIEDQLPIILSNSSCELENSENLSWTCDTNLSESAKLKMIFILVNCYLRKLNRSPLCDTHLQNLDHCLSTLSDNNLLLFTKFYQEFENNCRHLIVLQELELQNQILEAQNIISNNIFNQM